MAPERRPETLRRWQVKDVELEHGDDRMLRCAKLFSTPDILMIFDIPVLECRCLKARLGHLPCLC